MTVYRKSAVLFLVIVALARLSQCQTVQGRLNLAQAIDRNNDDVIEDTEVIEFYGTFPGGSPVTRCEFEERIVGLGARAEFASAMFDFLQQPEGEFDDWRLLTMEEWITAMMGTNATLLNKTDFQEKLKQLYREIQVAMGNPVENTDQQNGLTENNFNVSHLTNDADANGDGQISHAELTTVMRSLDENKDFGIQRCEFVDAMMSRYRQQPLTANAMFKLLFKSLEITWADVDTVFLMDSINGDYREQFVTSEAFAEYMTELNNVAAGEVREITTSPPADHASTLTFQLCSLVLSGLVTGLTALLL